MGFVNEISLQYERKGRVKHDFKNFDNWKDGEAEGESVLEGHDGPVFGVCFRHPSKDIKRQFNTQATRRIR